MISALIVDDEYLVRKGMILTVEWEKYHIEIVGEADSAEGALDFLSKQPVDLVITDIAMPNTSGFELIDSVTCLYPDIFIVVISCHQDFDYLQKAIRMGAIDYIVKTELEEEELDSSLNRISQRIHAILQTKALLKQNSNRTIEEKRDYVLVVPVTDNKTNQDLPFLSGEIKFDIGRGMVLYALNIEKANNFLSSVTASVDFVAVAVEANKLEHDKLIELLIHFTDSILPFEYVPTVAVYTFDPNKLNMDCQVDNGLVYELKKDWSDLKWLFNDKEYERLKTRTLSARPDRLRMKSIFYKAFSELEMYLGVTIPEEIYLKCEQAKFWADYEILTQELRVYMISKFNYSSYPDETIDLIFNAIEYIKANFSNDIGQESVAKMVNFSRSYFSKTFKEIVGYSFTEYIHRLRMEKAKTILLKTSLPVFRVTSEVGFLDEKYFSKAFKAYTGFTPTEYRSRN